MKLNKLILPLMLALVAMLATTGCRKGFNGITPIPGHGGPMVGDGTGGNTLPSGPILNTDQNPTFSDKPGQISTSDIFDPANMRQDRDALAAQTVYFAYDSAAVLSKEETKLVIVSEKLKSDPSAKLLIEGHCDERGTEEYNRALGERRALALREALVHAGISADNIRTISYGKDKPAETGHNEAAWSKNRRGEFVLCYPK